MEYIKSFPYELFSFLEAAWRNRMHRVARDAGGVLVVDPPSDPPPSTVPDAAPGIDRKRESARRTAEETDSLLSSLIGLAVLFILGVVILKLLNKPIILR